MNLIYQQWFEHIWNQVRPDYCKQLEQHKETLEQLKQDLAILQSSESRQESDQKNLAQLLQAKRQELEQLEQENQQDIEAQSKLQAEQLMHLKLDCEQMISALLIEHGLDLLPQVARDYALQTDLPLKSFELALQARSEQMQAKWHDYLEQKRFKVRQLHEKQGEIHKAIQEEETRFQSAQAKRDRLIAELNEYNVSNIVFDSILHLSPEQWSQAQEQLKAMLQDARLEQEFVFLKSDVYPSEGWS